MRNLIQQLKNEHAFILEKFTKVSEIGLGTDEGHTAVWEAKDALFSHLLKEDRLLYPPLLRAAEKNGDLRDILATFNDEINALALIVDEFYSGYTVKTDLPSIYNKFQIVFEQLKIRIKHEEDFLFNEFSKLSH
jgi:hypothetical protein